MAVAIAGPSANNITVRHVRVVSTTTAVSHGGDNWVIDDLSANIVTNFLTSTAGHSFLTITNCFTAGLIDVSDCDWVNINNNHLRSLIELGAASSVTVTGNTLDSPGGSGTYLINGDGVRGVVFANNNYVESDGYDAVNLANSSDLMVGGNVFGNNTSGFHFDTCTRSVVAGNSLGGQASAGAAYLGEHGIELTDCDDMIVTDNRIFEPGQDADDTYDGIFVTGDSNRNLITGNVISAGTAVSPRYGINIGTATCDDNIVVGNAFGGTADYASGALGDSGTNTVTSYPGGTLGDNFGV